MLEFPLFPNIQPPSNIPLDICLKPLQCFVQVKSTDLNPGRWPVKLDNWTRFINTPTPAFFLVLEYDGKDLCQRAYLVHVDETYIKKVLKKLREISNKNKKMIHKKKIKFKYNNKNQILPLNGEGFAKAIENYVGGSPVQYAEKKIQTVRSIGYENDKSLFKFEVSLPDKEANIEEYLVDFLIGLNPYLKISKGEIKDIRFGIVAEEPYELFGSGRLEIDRCPDKGKILLNSKKKDRPLSIETDVNLPNGIITQQANFKMRFFTPFLDIVLSPFKKGENVITFKFDFLNENKKYSLNILKQMADVVLFLNETGKKGFEIQFEYKEKSLGTSKIEPISNEIFDYKFLAKMARCIENAWEISKYFNVHNEIEMYPQESLRQESHLQFMENIITRSGGMLKIKFWPDEDKKISDSAKKMCVPFLSHVIIGQYQMAISAAILEGSIFKNPDDDSGYEMISQDVRLCRQYIWKRGSESPCTEQEALQNVIDDFDDLTKVALFKGIHDNFLNNS